MLNAHRLGVVLGGAVAAVHAGWHTLIALGLAQPLMVFIFKIHSFTPMYEVGAFSVSSAVMNIVIAGIVGYVVGYIIAKPLNWAHGA